MKVMILAAGRGERMRPLTDKTPKPLLKIDGKSIIQRTLEQLVAAGFNEIVINLAHLGDQIRQALGNGQQFGGSIHYSDEGNRPLETAGGITKALPLLGEQPFLVVNGDIVHNFDFSLLHSQSLNLAHLILIANPVHHPEGDFYLSPEGVVYAQGQPKFTYSGIGLFSPQLFVNNTGEPLKLGALLRQVMPLHQVSGELFQGEWADIGTPDRLKQLDQYYRMLHYLKTNLP